MQGEKFSFDMKRFQNRIKEEIHGARFSRKKLEQGKGEKKDGHAEAIQVQGSRPVRKGGYYGDGGYWKVLTIWGGQFFWGGAIIGGGGKETQGGKASADRSDGS